MPLMPGWLYYGLAAIAGLCLGSFAGLLAWRLPRGLPVIAGRSCCPACARPLSMRELAPLVSYVWQRGRCAQCGAPISRRYPLIELAAAVLSVLALWAAGPGVDAVLLALFAIGLLIVIVVDFEFQIIPDTVLIALALLGAAWRYPDLADAGLGMAVGGAVAWVLRLLFSRLRRREVLGLGDVKFFMMAGIWCGIAGLPGFMMVSGVFGILFGLGWRARGGAREFPFGPALSAGLFIVVLSAQLGLVY